MWNAFLLHPRNKDGGNRPPTSAELEMGAFALSTIVDLFPGVKILSIGQKAEKVCKKVGVRTAHSTPIRLHTDTIQMFRRYCKSLNISVTTHFWPVRARLTRR